MPRSLRSLQTAEPGTPGWIHDAPKSLPRCRSYTYLCLSITFRNAPNNAHALAARSHAAQHAARYKPGNFPFAAMSNLKIGFKRLTGSVDDLKHRFRKRDRDETPPVVDCSFELMAPRSPVDEPCNPISPPLHKNRTVMVESASTEDSTVEISMSSSSVSLSSKDAVLLDRFSIVREPSILLKKDADLRMRSLGPDLNRPLPPAPCEGLEFPRVPPGFEAHARDSVDAWTEPYMRPATALRDPLREHSREPSWEPSYRSVEKPFKPVKNPEPAAEPKPVRPQLTVKLQPPMAQSAPLAAPVTAPFVAQEEFEFRQQMRELESELVDASTALDTETEALVQDMHELSALTGVKGLEYAPTPLLHKNSTRSTLFKRVQCAEHDAYQLRIENEIMSKKVANGNKLQAEMQHLKHRNNQLFEELSAIEKSAQHLQLESTSSELSTFVQTEESEGTMATAPTPHTASIAGELASQVATELLAEAHLQWQQERKTLKAEIKLLSDNGAELERELKTSNQQCQQLKEEVQQAESSYSALYASFKNVQTRYKATLQQLDTHLREMHPDPSNLSDLMEAQNQLMQGQRQLLRLQEYYGQALQAAYPDTEKIGQVFSILEPLLRN